MAEYQLEKIASIREKLTQITEDDIQVAISHMPLDDEYVSTMLQWTTKEDVFSFHRVSLILAGHYCAGQWRILPGGSAVLPGLWMVSGG